EGYTLLDADYSQIELRVVAAMCDDENLKNAFLSGTDIHTATASKVFGLPESMISPEMRRAAKAVNFGIIYGIGAFSLSKDIGSTVKEADRYIKNYLESYSGVKKFMEDAVESAMKNGYVTTIYGRRRYIPEIASSNKVVQAFGKRAAMNAPVQGSAADIIKQAMVNVYKKLKEENLDAKLILQVHDELIVEVSEKDKERAKVVLGEEMENAVKLSVPMTADVTEGQSWYVAKG
ncbi:MAG: DNA polymerase I, partial [Oscillospiraceae bacterium]|nr:DNA polymerase I [Oscillospiraceae bacterium]